MTLTNTGLFNWAPPPAPQRNELAESLDNLRVAIENLSAQISALQEQIADISSPPSPATRQITEGEGRKEIKYIFEAHHGDVLYPSDIAEMLNLDYEFVVRIIEELVESGDIATT